MPARSSTQEEGFLSEEGPLSAIRTATWSWESSKAEGRDATPVQESMNIELPAFTPTSPSCKTVWSGSRWVHLLSQNTRAALPLEKPKLKEEKKKWDQKPDSLIPNQVLPKGFHQHLQNAAENQLLSSRVQKAVEKDKLESEGRAETCGSPLTIGPSKAGILES